jgi:hypothetical protein
MFKLEKKGVIDINQVVDTWTCWELLCSFKERVLDDDALKKVMQTICE